MAMTDHDLACLRRVIALARKGRFAVEPNPPVGCVIEGPDGAGIVGEGWHRGYGGAHAEIEALALAGAKARGATVYVSLEPCCVEGKTGPCSQALIEAGVARVVFATVDPNPAVKGKGAAALRAAGIEVEGPALPAEGDANLGPFRRALARARPWVVSKWAMSLDGAIAARPGVGGAITGDLAKQHTHLLRGRVDAVAIGIGTALADDPRLTCRLAGGPPDGRTQPLRVIFDSALRLPLDSRLVVEVADGPVLVCGAEGASAARRTALEDAGVQVQLAPQRGAGIDLDHVLRSLHESGVRRLLVEGGATLHGSLIRAGLVDQISAWVAPRILGGAQAVPAVRGSGIEDTEAALVLEDPMWRRIGADLLLQGYVPSTGGASAS